MFYQAKENLPYIEKKEDTMRPVFYRSPPKEVLPSSQQEEFKSIILCHFPSFSFLSFFLSTTHMTKETVHLVESTGLQCEAC